MRPFSVFTNFNRSQNPFSRALSHTVRPVTPCTSAEYRQCLECALEPTVAAHMDRIIIVELGKQTNPENRHINMLTRFAKYLYC